MPFQRPNLPYVAVSLLNSNRYEVLKNTNSPVPFQALDGDSNYLIDTANNLQTQIDGLVVGILPGSNNPQNAGIFPTTDGNGNISWILVGADQLANGAVTQVAMAANSVGTPQYQNASITGPKIAPNVITGGLNGNLAPQTVQGYNLSNSTITSSKITSNTITGGLTGNLALQTITGDNIALQTIPGSRLVNQTITTSKVALNTLTGGAEGNIATQTIDESNMIASSVGASTINGAFVVFNGQQGIGVIATISQSNNIVNVVKSSTGVYTVTFSNPNNYTFYTLGGNAYWTALNNPSFIQVTRITSTTFNISVVNSTFTAFDSSNITAGIIFQST